MTIIARGSSMHMEYGVCGMETALMVDVEGDASRDFFRTT
jgi:hypothetical protein